MVAKEYRRVLFRPHTECALRVRRLSAAILVALLAVGLLCAGLVRRGLRPAPRQCPRSSSSSARRATRPTATGLRRSAAAAIARQVHARRRRALLPQRDVAGGQARRSQGASLVVYMGHGNGWPSRYRD